MITAEDANVVARVRIAAGTSIPFLVGSLALGTPEQMAQHEKRQWDFSLVEDEEFGIHFIFGPVRLCNHDCKPNASLHTEFDGSPIVLRALKIIGPEEEIAISCVPDARYLDMIILLWWYAVASPYPSWEDNLNRGQRTTSRSSKHA